LHGRKKDADECPDDGHHDQEFDEAKAGEPSVVRDTYGTGVNASIHRAAFLK
jgi:hypothetical protein